LYFSKQAILQRLHAQKELACGFIGFGVFKRAYVAYIAICLIKENMKNVGE
jgi:hypothetical protein